MVWRLFCVLIVCLTLFVGSTAVAGTPMPIPPSSEIAALGPQPEPPDCGIGVFNWFRELLRSLFF